MFVVDSGCGYVIFRKETTRIVQHLVYQLSYLSYLKFLFLSFVRPFYFSHQAALVRSLPFAILVFLLNFTLAISFLIQQRYIQQPKMTTLIQSASGFLFFYPLVMLCVFFLAAALHFLAVLFGGKGSFKQTLIGVGLSTYPLLFVFIPEISLVSFLYWAFLLMTIFSSVQKFKFRYAFFTVGFPLMALVILLGAIGFLNLSPITATIFKVTSF